MIDDLIFKGRTVEEALEKSSHFFGVQKERIRYQIIEDGPEEVAIRLIENPMMPRPAKQYQETERTFVSGYDRQPRPSGGYRDSGNRVNTGHDDRRPPRRNDQQSRPPQGRSFQRRDNYGSRGPQQRDNRRPGDYGMERNDNNFRPPRENWQPETVDLSPLNEKEREAFAFVEKMLRQMSYQTSLSFTQDQDRLIFNISGPDRSMLLAKKGEPLVSIQYLVNKIYLGNSDEGQPIFVDSMGYRVSRDEELHEIAVMSAEKVRKTRREYILSPMNPYERRIVHLAIKDFPGVFTESQGEGYIKRVAIYPGDR